jgi:hypothetical protein
MAKVYQRAPLETTAISISIHAASCSTDQRAKEDGHHLRAFKDPLDLQEMMAKTEVMEKVILQQMSAQYLVRKVQSDHRERKERKVMQVRQVLLDCRVRLDLQVLQVLPDHQDLLEVMVQMVRKEQPVQPVLLAQKGRQERLDLLK